MKSAEGINMAGDVAIKQPPALDVSSLTRNSSIAMAGGLVSQGLKFLVVIYVAREFSTTQFGWFSFAVAVNAYITIISNFGLPVFGSRAISKSGRVSRELLQEILCIRFLLAAGATALSVGLLSFFPQISRIELLLVGLFGLSNLPLAGFVDWVFQGLHRQDCSAVLNIAWQAGWLAFTVVGIALGIGILSVAIALGTSAAIASLTGYLWLRRRQTLRPEAGSGLPLRHRSWKILKAAAPLGWGTMLISVVVWTDAICVRLLRGEVAVAIYAAGNRAALALSMLGTFYVQGAFPFLSRASDQSSSLFESWLTRTFADLAILFVPGSLWAICYAKQIIEAVFRRPDFAAAVPVFRLFQVTLLLFVLNTLLGTGVLVAFHCDVMFRRVLAWSTLLFLAFCPLLTWSWGNTGAAISVLMSQVFAFIWFWLESRPMVTLRFYETLRWPFLAGASAVGVCLVFGLSIERSLVPVALAYLILLTARSRAPQESLA